MKRIVLLCAVMLLSIVARAEDKDGWVTILDEKSFKEWKLMPNDAKATVEEGDGVKKFDKGQWTFKDGVLKGEGNVSHIFSPRGDYENFHYKAEIKINDKGNGGQYFRAKLGNGWPSGYEAQVNSTHSDPKRTGSLYNFVNVSERLVEPDTWFTQEVIADGNHIIIKVNGKVTVDYTDVKNTHQKGHFAFQQHHQGSEISVRNVQVKEIKK
ncbi:MAG TPA: DUF1080 domain-containing protein [Planctomycetota bacterium]|nr:DUF1080 domain-containing protein [Planctomycetota bacterium]